MLFFSLLIIFSFLEEGKNMVVQFSAEHERYT